MRRAKDLPFPSVAVWLALLASTLLPGRARACASCGCGDPTLTAMGVEKPYKDRVRLSLEERFGGHTMGSFPAGDAAWTLRSSLSASYSPIARITFMGLLPLVSTWISDGGGPYRNETGLGDAELSARGVILEDRSFSPRHLLSVMAGLKMPTGPRVFDDHGYPFPEDDQPGSGSWDPFAGISYGYFGDKLSAFSSVGYRYTTPGRRDYLHGRALGATVGMQLQPAGWVAFSVAADLRYQTPDRLESGVDAPDTGGTMIALTPAITFAPVERWLIKLSAQVHVADWFYGVQSESHALLLSTVVDLN